MALDELKPGIPIRASQVALQRVEEFPQRRVNSKLSLKHLEGYASPPFYFREHARLERFSGASYRHYERRPVAVVVNSGLAVLSFDAEARLPGTAATSFALKNPESGKLFRARVEAPGRAGVITPIDQIMKLAFPLSRSSADECHLRHCLLSFRTRIKQAAENSAADQYVKDAESRVTTEGGAVTPGSTWSGLLRHDGPDAGFTRQPRR